MVERGKSMRIRALTIAVLGTTLLVAGGSRAQQQQANPLDTVPDNMPFDVPYGAPISLDHAQAAIAAAVAESKKHNWKMNVAVVDSGGNLVAFQRMDGAQLASVPIAEHKARAAVTFRRETKIFENAIQQNNFHYIMTLDAVIASRGGIPLVEGGKMIGAIGCSGGTGAQDEVVCKSGAATVMK
jgi:glc operon protein GlcG